MALFGDAVYEWLARLNADIEAALADHRARVERGMDKRKSYERYVAETGPLFRERDALVKRLASIEAMKLPEPKPVFVTEDQPPHHQQD